MEVIKIKRAMNFSLIVISIIMLSIFTYAQDFINLTDQERDYLATRGPIKLVVDPDWYPYEKLDENGKHLGIASDLIGLIAARIGIKFEIVSTLDWKDSLKRAKSADVDGVSFLNKTEERSQWLLFTEPYFVDPNVLITREEHDYISSLSRYIDETMVLPEGTSIEERLRQDYPNLNIVLVNSETEAIEYVEDKKADFTLRSLTMAAFVIKNDGHFNLKIAGEIPDYKNQLRMGITKEDKVLQSILNKGIASISDQDVQDAINHYIAIKVMKGFDYKLFFIIFSVFSVALLSTLYWLRRVQSLNKMLEASAVTDVLTGLKNRLFFNQRALVEIERFKRYETRLSLLMIDIDRFKRINDTYGHDTGDEVLKRVSNELQNQLRKADLIARWGGEEFIVLLPETKIEEAICVAEKLRERVESLIFKNNEVLTISIGISMLVDSETLESWIMRADKALYHAKRQGRNRSCISSDVSEANLIDIIQWDPAWISGYPKIDQQHTELLTMCNELMNNLLNGDYRYSFLPELEQLIYHISEHFVFEEEILDQYAYSDLEIHKKLHDDLMAKAQNLVQKSENGYLLPIDVTRFILDDVLVKHLLKEDTLYFGLFKENN